MPSRGGFRCASSRIEAKLVKEPVDIILLLDNSGSMADELQAVEERINVSFSQILESRSVDYRVILISRHRRRPRSADPESSTSVCVEAPLSSQADCVRAPTPALSQRFFHYSTKVESNDSFDVLLDTYAPPWEDPKREDKYGFAPQGWSQWLRVGSKKVFLEVTDDDEDMPVSRFLEQLSALSPEHFGSDPRKPNFVFHSIVGLAEQSKPDAPYQPSEALQQAHCTGNGGAVTSAGVAYQELSRMTGGLRFPICQFGAYNVVFETIANDLVLTRRTACEIPIPQSRGPLELDNIAISYESGAGAPSVFGQAASYGACQDNAFYVNGQNLVLCPLACDRLREDPAASIDVLFTCESQLIR